MLLRYHAWACDVTKQEQPPQRLDYLSSLRMFFCLTAVRFLSTGFEVALDKLPQNQYLFELVRHDCVR